MLSVYPSTWHNRFIRSTSGSWSGARAGAGLYKFGFYQRPDNYLQALTKLNASYWIWRVYMALDTGELPAGKVVKAARLGLFVTEVGIANALVYITKGLWDEPVVLEDFALQTDETTDLGHMATGDMVVGQYNWIDLNEAGIAWINQRPLEIKQHESYDWKKNSWHPTYPPWQWSQSFTPQTTHTLTSLKLRGWRTGSPGTFTVYLKAVDANHVPTGPVLAEGSINANTLPTVSWGEWFEVDLGAGYTVAKDTEYCFQYLCPAGNSSNCVNLAGATAYPYPNGYRGYSDDNGSTWTSSDERDIYFIEYETATVGGTKFCLRMYGDVNDSPPGFGVDQRVRFYSAQKGEYKPLLALEVPAGRSQAHIT